MSMCRLKIGGAESKRVDAAIGRVAVVDAGGRIDRRFDLMASCLEIDLISTGAAGADYMEWVHKVEIGDIAAVEIDGNAWVAHVAPSRVWFEGLYSQGEGGDVTFEQFKFAVAACVRYLRDPSRNPIDVEFPSG